MLYQLSYAHHYTFYYRSSRTQTLRRTIATLLLQVEGAHSDPLVPRFYHVARLAGFEPATLGLEGRCSIHMSYRRNLTAR